VVDQTDFLDLYRKLRLEADCTLAEFKQAYRRHVAQWHPDRRRGTRADALAAARLQRLTVQYSAAMDFHKRHGRLPGAPVSSRLVRETAAPTRIVTEEPDTQAADISPHTLATPSSAASDASPASPARPANPARRTRWLAVGGILGAAIFGWSLIPSAAVPPDDSEADAVVVTGQSHRPPVATQLTSGMSADEVIAVEGEPMRRGEDHWEYGPSWIRFDGGEVTDWYSSPLRPLHVSTVRARP